MRTLGLIGGMSWESSALYYKLINERVRNPEGDVTIAIVGKYTGMKDAESTPSPNRFWRKLGMRNAARKASAASELPK